MDVSLSLPLCSVETGQYSNYHADWPYCSAAKHMVQIAASDQELTDWNGFQWRRRIEAFGSNDDSIAARGPAGENKGIWCAANA